MIPNVTRGGRARGLLRYLTAPKQQAGEEQAVDAEPGLAPRELHKHPHLVAASGGLLEEWGGYDLSPRYNPSAADAIAAWLDEPRVRSGARVSVPRRDQQGAVMLDQRGVVVRKDAHVWHCSLSLHPEETARSDEQWGQIASELVSEMGFGGCRWIALRHGLSPAGNDHIHVVVQLVDNDGKPANVHNDRPRVQEACRALEQRHGLRVVEGRQAKRGAAATSYRQRYRAEREHERAVRDGQPSRVSSEPDREILERAVRLSAAASASEAEFIRRLRAEGLILRPRFAAGREDQVVGYAVALAPGEGREVVAHAGGTLAKDLTLPRLRGAHGWTADDGETIDEWRRAFQGREPGVGSESDPRLALPAWEDALAELEAIRDSARELPNAPAAARADLAASAAAVLGGWASLPGEHQAALRDAAQRLALSAQIRAAQARLAPALPRPRGAALLLLAASQPKNRTVQLMALAAVMSGLVDAIARQHEAAGELQQARALAGAVAELAPLRAELERQRAVEDPAWAGEQQALAVARAARAPAGVRPWPSPSKATPAPNQPPGQSQSPKRKR